MFTGCDCAEIFAARVQACTDQAVGVYTLTDARVVEPTRAQWRLHYSKLSELLQAAVNEFVTLHGEPDAAHQVEAAEWLVRQLVM